MRRTPLWESCTRWVWSWILKGFGPTERYYSLLQSTTWYSTERSIRRCSWCNCQGISVFWRVTDCNSCSTWRFVLYPTHNTPVKFRVLSYVRRFIIVLEGCSTFISLYSSRQNVKGTSCNGPTDIFIIVVVRWNSPSAPAWRLPLGTHITVAGR